MLTNSRRQVTRPSSCVISLTEAKRFVAESLIPTLKLSEIQVVFVSCAFKIDEADLIDTIAIRSPEYVLEGDATVDDAACMQLAVFLFDYDAEQSISLTDPRARTLMNDKPHVYSPIFFGHFATV